MDQKDVSEDKFGFERFDVVENFPDHYYANSATSWTNQPPTEWTKKIQAEWRMLQSHLPGTIFVRVCESRMDLLRAAIIGAQGTPYHDGLFFFDISFPSNYPSVPPLVYYHSRGLRINPNLYSTGYVRLSLLYTWSGRGRELWNPIESSILKVLVSIQGLILNSNPFFNEPAFAGLSGSFLMKTSSRDYNEKALILSLKTMVCSIRNPPKHFEDFVAGYFSRRGRDVLVACKSYIEGARVGSLVNGVVRDPNKLFRKRCSKHFRKELFGYITTLVEAFQAVRVQDCDELLSLIQNAAAGKSTAPEKIPGENTAPKPTAGKKKKKFCFLFC